MGSVLVQKGLYEQAMDQYQKVMDLIKGVAAVEISVKAIMAQAYAKWGKRDDALQLLDEVITAGTASPYSIAGIYAALGEYDSTFDWLNKAYEQRDLQLVSLKVDPTLDAVRDDQRFQILVTRVGLP